MAANPAAHPTSVHFGASTLTPPAGDACQTLKISDGSSPICGLCRNGRNTVPANYPSFIVYDNPHRLVICTPCAQSIATALAS